jgi:hypothetical protein
MASPACCHLFTIYLMPMSHLRHAHLRLFIYYFDDYSYFSLRTHYRRVEFSPRFRYLLIAAYSSPMLRRISLCFILFTTPVYCTSHWTNANYDMARYLFKYDIYYEALRLYLPPGRITILTGLRHYFSAAIAMHLFTPRDGFNFIDELSARVETFTIAMPLCR